MDAGPYKILFLCTGNSARSIMAEYLMRQIGGGRFESFSAGSHPTGRVNPVAVRVLRELAGMDASWARSKSWDEFKGIPFDFVITVCDHARESCPLWPGKTVMAHWSFEDPAAIQGNEEEKFNAFVKIFLQIKRCLERFHAIPMKKLDRSKLEAALLEIGNLIGTLPDSLS